MSNAPIPWKHLVKIMFLFSPIWLGGAVLFGALGLGYAVNKKDEWSARQSMVIRDEANSSVYRPGRFDSQTELKAAQETILQIARNPEVVAAALRDIGPPPGENADDWPTATVIDEIADSNVNIRAPQGSDFGNTEVVFLSVKQSSKERALAFCDAVFENLTEHLRTIRRLKADSMITELTYAREVAKQNVDESSSKMQEIEIAFGSDLGELRNLSETISGDGSNRRELEITNRELQQVELGLIKLESLYNVLVQGAEDPQKLLIAGNDLLTSQPSLQRLKLGLIDAQIKASQMAGIYTEIHPKRIAAVATEKEIKSRMQQESAAVLKAMEPQLTVERNRLIKLTSKKQMFTERLAQLAKARTSYSKIAAEVKFRTEQLASADRVLSEAMASRSAAMSTNFLATLGPPQVSDSPVGSPRSVLVMGATTAGLIFGFGVVFLVAPGPNNSSQHGRRWSDYLQAQSDADSNGKTRANDEGSTQPELPIMGNEESA